MIIYSKTIIDFKLIVTFSQVSPKDKHGKLLSNNQSANKVFGIKLTYSSI